MTLNRKNQPKAISGTKRPTKAHDKSMTKPATTKTPPKAPQVPLELLKVRGRDFDANGTITPFKQLAEAPGIFEFKDVKDRLPFAEKRLRHWMQNASFTGVFYFLNPGGKAEGSRRVAFIDLRRFADFVRARFGDVDPNSPSLIDDED